MSFFFIYSSQLHTCIFMITHPPSNYIQYVHIALHNYIQTCLICFSLFFGVYIYISTVSIYIYVCVHTCESTLRTFERNACINIPVHTTYVEYTYYMNMRTAKTTSSLTAKNITPVHARQTHTHILAMFLDDFASKNFHHMGRFRCVDMKFHPSTRSGISSFLRDTMIWVAKPDSRMALRETGWACHEDQSWQLS